LILDPIIVTECAIPSIYKLLGVKIAKTLTEAKVTIDPRTTYRKLKKGAATCRSSGFDRSASGWIPPSRLNVFSVDYDAGNDKVSP